jgi:hypothetical protein
MDVSLIVFSLAATFFAAALTVPAGFGLGHHDHTGCFSLVRAA